MKMLLAAVTAAMLVMTCAACAGNAAPSAAQVPQESALPQVSEEPATGRLEGVGILIDPGHGGFDGGAVGFSGAVESELNLAVSIALRDALEAEGANTAMTRDEDVALGSVKSEDMKNRAALIAASEADLLISIHQNKYPDTSVSGPQVFYDPSSERGMALAQAVQSALIAELRPEKERVPMSANYLVLRSGSMPAVIVECGFVSNPAEEELLRRPEYRQRLADAIVCGICAFLEGEQSGEA